MADADAALHAAGEALATGDPGADHAVRRGPRAVARARRRRPRGPPARGRGPGGLDVDPARPLGSLSGGQAARATLVAVLLSRYDVLLLDEPTNDLDARGQDLMASFVAEHDGPVLVASHDRAFLDRVATSVVELDLAQGRVAHYSGGWSDYADARALARRQAQEAFEEYADHRAQLVAHSRQRADWADKGRRQVARGDEPDKHQREKFRARADRQGAKSARLARAADRLAAVEQPRKEWQLRYSISAGSPSSDVVATLDGAVVERRRLAARTGRPDARPRRPGGADRRQRGREEHAARCPARPAAAHGRTRSRSARGCGSGLIDQQRELLETEATVAEVVAAEVGTTDRAAVRTLLAKYGLGAEHVDRPARGLSYGERTRALMATFAAREVNLLVLDEPTNHLDVAAVEQLEAALAGYDGTMVVVSHDRAFLDAVGVTRTSSSTTGWWPRSAEHAPRPPAGREAGSGVPVGGGLSGSAGGDRPRRARSASRRAPR